MALRILLVGLVALMGLDLPSGDELTTWTQSGRAWVDARMADLSRLRLEAERVVAPERGAGQGAVAATTEAASGRVDLAFEASIEGMISGFSADLSSTEVRRPTAEVAEVVPSHRETPRPEPIETDPALVVVESLPSPVSSLEKITAAVRLTRQAVDAWASVIQPTPDNVVDGEPADSL